MTKPTVQLRLSDDELGTILEALAEERDHFGGLPTPLEDRLLSAQRTLQAAVRDAAKRKTATVTSDRVADAQRRRAAGR